MQGDKLVLVPNTVDYFKATVRVLMSIDTSKGVAFYTYSLPEDRCTRLLKKMPEQDIRMLGRSWKSWNSGSVSVVAPESEKDRFPILHFTARGPFVSKVCALVSLRGLCHSR
jgi:hypothetical protein